MLETVTSIAGDMLYLMEGYFFYCILACLMKPRENRIVKVLGWILCSLVVNIIIYPGDVTNITLALPLFLVTVLIAFESGWMVRISAVMMFYPIVVALNFLMFETFGRIILLLWGEGTLENTVWSTVTYVVPVLFWYLYQRILKEQISNVRQLLDTRAWIFLDVICLASMTAIYSCVYYAPEADYKMVPCMAACMVTSMGSIRLAIYLADSIKGDLERKNLRLQKNYYEELEKNQFEIRKFRHDMKNHFAAAGQLLKEGEYQEAEAYFERLSGYMEARNRKFCENGIVNALLNVKYNSAVEAGIDCFFHIDIDRMMAVDDISLCTIFANTLDNAIEACQKIEEPGKRKLSVKARYTNNEYFSYEIVNHKVNEIRKKRDRFLTDKADSKAHGLGIASVREAVETYKGTMDISYTEDEFRIVILLEV
ncbi:MAG: GHKL domain-containing protein [Eubacteriales bacterium]|nr:GHKL domain-containing protein [Eubacteriales bacterium]